MAQRICIGYGEYEGKCQEAAGTPWSPYWCDRCNRLRMDKISAALDRLVKKE